MKINSPLFLFMLTSFFLNEGYGMNIAEAIKNKLVKADITWHFKSEEETSSLRRGSNLIVTLQNLSNQFLTVEIPSGFLFTASDSTKQNMLLTHEIYFKLLPKQSKVETTYGYCCEAKDGGPKEKEVYKIKYSSTEKLKKLARFVAENNLNGYAVQRAIWCVSDNHNLNSISSEDTTELRKLLYFTGILMNYSQKEIDKAFVKSLNGGKEFEKLIRLEIPVKSDESEIWIVIQNVNNTKLQTILTKQKPGKGLLIKQFGVSSIDLGKGEFTIRVYSTDSNVREQKFKLDV